MKNKKVAPYTSLLLPDKRVNVDYVAEKIREKSTLELFKQHLDKVKEAYKSNKGKGDFIPLLLKFTEEHDKELADILRELIELEEPALVLKADIIQQVVFTGIFLKTLLLIIADENTTEDKVGIVFDILGSLRFDYIPDVWLDVYQKDVISLLIKLKDDLRQQIKHLKQRSKQ